MVASKTIRNILTYNFFKPKLFSLYNNNGFKINQLI